MLSAERHLLPDLKERLQGFASPATVRIVVSPSDAGTREGQLLIWMLVNLLCRMKGVVGVIDLKVPRDLPLKSHIIPFPLSTGDFLTAVLEASKVCARDCEVLEARESSEVSDVLVLIGNVKSSQSPKFAIRVSCKGWLAYVGKAELATRLVPVDSPNPFGAFTAACIASGEVFKFLGGMSPESGKLIDSLCLSSFMFGEALEDSVYSNPAFVLPMDFGKVQVVGCGAVGNAFCHVLFSLEGLRANIDLVDRMTNEYGVSELVEENNLSRYVMLSSEDVGRPKASALVERVAKPNINATPFDDGFQAYMTNISSLEIVLSCVDNNFTRHAIQDQLPRVEIGASTYLMTAQLSLYDLEVGTPCLKCNNPLEQPVESDETIRNRLLSLPPAERAREATRVGVRVESLETLLQGPDCGQLDPISIQKFARLDTRRDWAVSFVSFMSGVMLAAELFKTRSKSSGLSRRSVDGKRYTDMYFNFWYDKCTFTKSLPNPSCWCSGAPVRPRDVYSSLWHDKTPVSPKLFKLADPERTPEQKERVKLLDNALLFISSVLVFVLPILLLAKAVPLPAPVQYAPIILFTLVMPLYVGYMRGAVEFDSAVERLRGWEYLFVGAGAMLIQITLSTVLGVLDLAKLGTLDGLLFLLVWMGGIVTFEMLMLYFAGRSFVSWFLQMARGRKEVEVEEGIALVGTASVGFLVSLYSVSSVTQAAPGLVIPFVLWLLVLLIVESNTHRYLHMAGNLFAGLSPVYQANTIIRYFYWVRYILVPGRIHVRYHQMIMVGLILVIVGAILPLTSSQVLLFGESIEFAGLSIAFSGAILHARAP